MANGNDLSGKVGLDITDFKANIAELNRQARVIESGFRATAAGMDDWRTSSEGLQSRIDSLSKIIDIQKQKIENLKTEYNQIVESKGKDSKAAQDLEVRINKETEGLNKNEKELKDTTNSLNDFGKEEDQETSKTENLHGALSKIGTGLKNVGGTIGKAAVTSIAAVGTAAVAAGAGIGAMVMSASKNADELQRLSDVTGMSAETLQTFQYEGSALGVSLDTITGAQTKLIKSMSSAYSGSKAQAAAFETLHVSVKDLHGGLRDSQETMGDVFDALQKVENPTQRDALAMQIFGKSARDLNPMILAGSAGLNKLSDEAEKNGAIISDKNVAALDAFGDSVDALKLSAKGMAGTLAVGILPVLNQLVTLVGNLSGALNTAIKTGDFSQLGIVLSDGITSAINQVATLTGKLVPVAMKILSGLINAIVTAIPQVLPALTVGVLQLLNSAVAILQQNGPLLISAAIQAITTLAGGLIQALPQIITAAIQIIIALANGLVQALPQLIPAVIQAVLTIVQGLLDNLTLLIDVAIKLILALVQGILNALPKLLEQAPKIIETIVTGIIGAIPKLVDASIKIIMAIVNFLLNHLDLVISAAIQIVLAIAIGLIKAIPQLVAAVPKLVAAIIGVFIHTNWLDVGWQIVKGIADGLIGGIGYLGDAAKRLANSALNSIKQKLGIHSPSAVFRDEVGQNISLGVAQGIAGTASKVDAAMAGLANNLTTKVNTELNVNAKGNIQQQALNDGNKSSQVILQIENFYNNSKEDIRELAQELQFYVNGTVVAKGGNY